MTHQQNLEKPMVWQVGSPNFIIINYENHQLQVQTWLIHLLVLWTIGLLVAERHDHSSSLHAASCYWLVTKKHWFCTCPDISDPMTHCHLHFHCCCCLEDCCSLMLRPTSVRIYNVNELTTLGKLDCCVPVICLLVKVNSWMRQKKLYHGCIVFFYCLM